MMKNKNYEIEHFEYFQELRGTKEEILYFKTERQMYRKEPIGLDFFRFCCLKEVVARILSMGLLMK
ncbi:hypothetical protein HS960_06470 [Sphingobacterium paramultivorum]|uniref:Uncharacterized protein n=1 Tax=Sphingobacterium paramultivorum TaxID=2886510 RepID=A0A7G5DZZ8_9SPHI|nr:MULTISPECIES: hypothetical protein [Sphingobacterium]MCS4164389.1 hypothetical protein [Sphingobacterium sp. BIGb0116]QMV67323.1 hypothetical protein HS960_06470 [Sphingobacterium paramultivorum]WSO16180.1 hypothetical protein VUL84_06450 [Sphingobacterium paramultivorum]